MVCEKSLQNLQIPIKVLFFSPQEFALNYIYIYAVFKIAHKFALAKKQAIRVCAYTTYFVYYNNYYTSNDQSNKGRKTDSCNGYHQFGLDFQMGNVELQYTISSIYIYCQYDKSDKL